VDGAFRIDRRFDCDIFIEKGKRADLQNCFGDILLVQAIPASRPNHHESENGMESKYEVARSDSGGCFICHNEDEELYLVRNAKTGQMTALCGCCLLPRLDGYLIDNTRTWPVKCSIDPWKRKPVTPPESD